MGQESHSLSFLAGGGECGQLARALDWSTTPLGNPSTWPGSLRAIVAMMLRSRHPMFLWWGPALIQIYNDAYLPSFGAGKHPAAMGQKGAECWQEIWPIISPQIDGVLYEQRASWNEDHLVPIFRNDRIEEVYWTYGYSPVIDDSGAVGGVLVVCTETTPRVLAERRARTMRLLGDRTAPAESPTSVIDRVVDVIRDTPRDVPFGFVYRLQKDGGVQLVQGLGLENLPRADVAVRQSLAALPASALKTHVVIKAEDLAPGALPDGCLGVFVVPFQMSPVVGPMGLLVFGLSAQLPFNEPYRTHLEQIAEHTELALARINAQTVRAMTDAERNNLLLQAPVATALMAGPEHVFQLANSLYCRMVGRTEIVGKRFLEVFPELADTPLRGVFDRVYQTGVPFVTEELLIPLDRRGDGVVDEAYFKFNLEPLRDDTGDVYGMMAVAVEITEQVRARHDLERTDRDREKLLDQAEAAARAKDEFLAMLGHELRNPLSPITTALQLMRLKGNTATEREQKVIERQVAHLTRLVDDLLDVSKITRGKVELRKELVDVADLVAKAVEMASDLLEQGHHRLTIDVPRGQLHTNGDPVRLAQVVSNLLTNAARYTDPGGSIDVRAWIAGDSILVRVSDNGTGISPVLLPQIFDVFVQGRRSPDRPQGGLGLGLALVKNLVGLHGGSVEASSAGPGQGSAFTVTLPASASSSKPTPQTSQLPEHIREAPKRSEGRRVLVVDDNVDAADSLAEFISDMGHEVQVAYDPVAAIEVSASFHPEVAVLDVGLPVMDGYELAQRLRAGAEGARIRLIALTGYGQAGDRARSHAAGFERHFVKPVDHAQLLTALASGAGRDLN